MAGAAAHEDESAAGGSVFSPPLYQQRYSRVLEVAREHHPMKVCVLWCISLSFTSPFPTPSWSEQVVDVGCAECKLLRLLKREAYIEHLVGVDVDPVPLRVHSAMIYPLITDHLHPRPRPLYMALMEGNHVYM